MKRHILSRLALPILLLVVFTLNAVPVAAVVGQWSVNGTSIYYNDGNVGFGTSTPQSKLHVVGGLRISRAPSTITNPNPPQAEVFFADQGQIRSLDNNHRILFRRSENIMEFREFGEIIFSPGAVNGTSTNFVTMTSGGSLNVANSFYTDKGLISLKPQNTVAEGGQLNFQPAGTNRYFYLDNNAGNLRYVTQDAAGESVKLSVSNNGDLDVQKSFLASSGLISLKAQDGVNEGGQLLLRGAGTNKYVYVDNVSGNFRVVTQDTATTETTKLEVKNNGDLKVNGKIVSDGDICIGAC